MCAIDRYMAMGASYLLNVGPDARGEIPDAYARRLRRIGDWYNRMAGCLESHEPDTFAYEIFTNEYIAVRKNGKTYFHFYNGVSSSAVSFKTYPALPKSVRLMNTARRCISPKNASPLVRREHRHRLPLPAHHRIPVDDLASEPVVIEVDWGV